MNYYVVVVWNDIEPELRGPFKTEEEQDKYARALKTEHGNDHGIFPLNVDDRGEPDIGAYAAGFFMREDT